MGRKGWEESNESEYVLVTNEGNVNPYFRFTRHRTSYKWAERKNSLPESSIIAFYSLCRHAFSVCGLTSPPTMPYSPPGAPILPYAVFSFLQYEVIPQENCSWVFWIVRTTLGLLLGVKELLLWKFCEKLDLPMFYW